MFKKVVLILSMAVLCSAIRCTAFAEENPTPEQNLKEQVLKILESTKGSYEAKTKYTVRTANIYEAPDDKAQILDTSLVNTSFEVVYESGGWSVITTQAGAAFIKSEFLSDTPVEVHSYTDEELSVLAHALAGESQNCSDQEQRYVGSVILNRVSHPAFPGTIKGVVFQRGQYSCVRDGNYYREPTQRNWANAKWLLENGSVLPANVIWQSGGKQGRGVYIKTSKHYYCY